MALGVMLVLSIVVFAVIEFSSANTRNSSLNERRQSAKAFAEAGVNHGASVLANKLSATPSFTSNLSGTAPIQATTVPWTATYQTGSSPPTWLVSATASLSNPTGPTAAVPRTVQAKFSWTAVPDLGAWKGVYAANQGSDCFMQNEVVVKTPVYIRQTSDTTETCIKNTGTRYLGPFLAIRGRFRSLDSGATVGQPASASQPGDPDYPNEFRVPDVHFSGGCGGSSPPYTACTDSSHRVYRCLTSPDPPCYSHIVPDIPKPTVDFTYWRNNAKPGPGIGNGCTVSSGSVPSFSSTSDVVIMGSAYNCEVWQDGELKGKIQWEPGTFNSGNTSGTAGTLTIHGVIYFRGKILLSSVYGKVSGTGVIYVEDSIMMDASPGALCGKLDTAAGRPLCNNSTGADGWDPGSTPDLVTFITGQKDGTGGVSMDIKNQFEYQGGAYTVGKFILQNEASFKGPLVTEKVELKNDSTIEGWTPLNIGFPGLPTGSTSNALTLVKGSWTG